MSRVDGSTRANASARQASAVAGRRRCRRRLLATYGFYPDAAGPCKLSSPRRNHLSHNRSAKRSSFSVPCDATGAIRRERAANRLQARRLRPAAAVHQGSRGLTHARPASRDAFSAGRASSGLAGEAAQKQSSGCDTVGRVLARQPPPGPPGHGPALPRRQVDLIGGWPVRRCAGGGRRRWIACCCRFWDSAGVVSRLLEVVGWHNRLAAPVGFGHRSQRKGVRIWAF